MTNSFKNKPHLINWKNIVIYNKFHFGVDPTFIKKIKRRKSNTFKYAPHYVHKKKITSKDIKTKAKEEDTLKMIYIFVLVGYDYKKTIFYNIFSNKNKKMIEEVYII
jgi:hypothetical protein